MTKDAVYISGISIVVTVIVGIISSAMFHWNSLVSFLFAIVFSLLASSLLTWAYNKGWLW